MCNFRFAIPSYNRVKKQKTLQMLVDLGYGKDDIVLSTQNTEDYAAYSEKYGDLCTVIYREGHSVSANRNTLLDYFDVGEHIVMLDDDLNGIFILKNKKLVKVDTRDELESLLNDLFDYASNNNCYMFGIYPVKNEYFMKATIDKKNIVNTFLGIINKERFDENYKTKEDIELCCRMMSNGYNVIRFNFVAVDASHRTSGGCKEVWESNENIIISHELVSKFPRLLRLNTKRKGEVLFYGGTH